MDKKNQILMSVLGVFALVIVTVGVSYAFFSYTRTGTTTSTITSGDISFSYVEGSDAILSNAFPVADSVGAADETDPYTFTVSGSVKGSADLKYNVTLMSATADLSIGEGEDDDAKGLLTNDQVKVSLQNTTSGAYAIGGANAGVKLSELTAVGTDKEGNANTNTFTAGLSTGECTVVAGQAAVSSGEVYKLKMWISGDVDYSNTALTDDETDEYNDAQTSVGKFSGYAYSLKVRVDAAGTSTYTAKTTS